MSIDLVLELAYNTLTVVWVALYAGVFAGGEQGAETWSFDGQCDSFKTTKREREIVKLVCAGHSNQEIAEELFISLGTVKDHNYTIFQKTGVRNRTQLANLFNRP